MPFGPHAWTRQHAATAAEWMRRGLSLLETGTPTALDEARRCFTHAIALREAVDHPLSPSARYDLAGSWMNHGDALLRLGGCARWTEAVASFDRAIALLLEDSPHPSPLWRRRQAIAWHNRALASRSLMTRQGVSEALSSLERAINSCSHAIAAELAPEDRRLLASAHAHRGCVLLQLETAGDVLQARQDARRAIEWIADQEESDPGAAETGFLARHVLCRALARLAATQEVSVEKDHRWLVEATDVVEQAMRRGRLWESRSVHRFRGWVLELFRFGARAYQAAQPQFLTKFLLETLDPQDGAPALPVNDEVLRGAQESMWLAVRHLHRDGVPAHGSPRFRALMDALAEFQHAEQRLAFLRSGGATPPRTPSLWTLP